VHGKKIIGRFIVKYQSAVMVCLILFFVHTSYAGSEVVYKQPRPEKALEAEKKSGQEREKDVTKPESKEGYVYNPAGKTDPFQSFIVKSEKGKGGATSLSARDLDMKDAEEIVSEAPETELEKIETSKLTLTAVIKGKSKVWAMVTDPKGKGYFLEKGTKIGTQSGVVDEIICEEQETAFGVQIVRKVIIKVPYRDRDRKIIYRSIEMEMPYATL
jgi:hypothetical protein